MYEHIFCYVLVVQAISLLIVNISACKIYILGFTNCGYTVIIIRLSYGRRIMRRDYTMYNGLLKSIYIIHSLLRRAR